ncbi:MAG: BatA domain-containing protein [Pirellulaceae bacterium]|nr:BatA domain-containing protein [Pirellulaceae bacterium]
MPTLMFSAWSFAHVGMLAWGVTIAIPIIIHLWNRRTQHVIRWAAMDFLLAAIHKHSRRLRLEQWLLLALRVAILALLALALADPLLSGFSGLQLGTDTTQRQHTVLVIDNSYSMAAQSGDQQSGNQTVFELAKSQAINSVRQSEQGDGFTLVTLGVPPQSIVGSIAFEIEDIVREINALTVGHHGADLAATITEIDRLIDATRRSHPGLESCRVIVFTDLGRTTWEATSSPDLQRAIAALAEKADLVVREIGEPTDDNVAVNRLAALTPLAPLRRPISFEVEVHNFSLREQRRRVEFLVDGIGVTQQQLVIPAEGSAMASFSHRFDMPGQHLVEVRIDGDGLNLDDHRWISVTTPTAIRVLCVEGRPNAARYVAFALDPTSDGTADFQTNVVSENALIDLELQQYDCLVLCNVGRLGGGEVTRLYDFVHAGGGLITILGDQVQPLNYNEQLAGENSGRPLIPAIIGELVRGGPHRLNALQYQHPLIAVFRGHERAGLLTLPIWRYFKLLPRTGSQTALAFDSGDPALMSQNIGRGRSVLLATSAGADSIDRTSDPTVPWSALISWPSFPPLAHEMVNFSVGGREARRNFLVGELWDVASLMDNVREVVVVDPTGQKQHASIDAAQNAGQTTRLSGVYRIEHPSTEIPTELVVVNLDTHEGDLERLASDDLPSQFGRGVADPGDSGGFGANDHPSQLFRLVLGAVFLLVLAESTFAWRLSRRSS